MANLVIREEDGWLEISDVVDELGPIPKQELWEFSGTQNIEQAQELLDMEAGDLIEEKIGTDQITGLRVVSVPDDMAGERLRVWIRHEKVRGGEEPEEPAEGVGPVDVERELEMARNVFGKLKPREKTRLRAALYHPDEKTWDDAYTIIIGADAKTSLWQAVIAVDPTFPDTVNPREEGVERWDRIPSQETLVAALRYATH